MLPDFVEIKRELADILTHRMRPSAAEQSVVASASHISFYEGDEWVVHRSDGTTERSGYEVMEGKMELHFDELEEKGFSAVREALMGARNQMVEQAEREMLDDIQEVVEETGNVMDAGGQPFTAELWLDSLEMLEFSFEKDGTWKPPTLVIHPSKAETVSEELQRIEDEPELKERLEDLVAQKREAWRDRESRRRVVD